MVIQQEQELRAKLSREGLKATPQRLLLFSALTERTDHPTAEDLFQQVQPQLPGLSLGTVYSTLEVLVKHKLANRVPVASGKMRYDARPEGHHHLYCSNTQEIIDFDDPELEQLIREHLARKAVKNFRIDSISLQIRGSKPQPDNQITFSNN